MTNGSQQTQNALMDPFVTLIVLVALIVSGVWGSIIVSALMKRHVLKSASPQDDARLEELREDHLLLTARIEQLEEEVGFFRELHEPTSGQLRSGAQTDPESGE